MKKKRTRFRRTRKMLKKAGKFVGGAVLAAGLMLGSGAALAQKKAKQTSVAVAEKKPKKEKIGLGLTLGAGHEFVKAEPRATAVVDANIQLPLKSSLYAAFGLNVPLRDGEQPVGVEELDIYLSTQVQKRVGMFIGGYISKHLWVGKISPEAGISLGLPAGFSAAASYSYLVGLDKPHLLIAKVGKVFLDGQVGVEAKCGYTIDSSASGRISVFVRPNEHLPKIGLDTIMIFNKKKVMFADTVLNASWRF
jgi:hypothetical protein